MLHSSRWFFAFLTPMIVVAMAAAPMAVQARATTLTDMANTLQVNAGFYPEKLDSLSDELGYSVFLPAIFNGSQTINEIVFVSDRDGNSELYSMRTNGSNLKRLTYTADFSENGPVWSPDGKQIVYSRADASQNSKIYVMNSDGTDSTYLTDGYNPDWSPDGTKLVFSSHRDGNSEIYVMAADGSNVQRLTVEPKSDNEPAWSPDGSKILFYSSRLYYTTNGMIFPGLFLMDVSGENVTAVILNFVCGKPSLVFKWNKVRFRTEWKCA